MNTGSHDDAYFMELAYRQNQNSTCTRRKISALIVKHGLVIAEGSNGVPIGIERCTKAKGKYQCAKNVYGLKYQAGDIYCRGIHSEIAAIIYAASLGISVAGATLYTTTRPCFQCTKAIINSGIIRVVYHLDYPLKEVIDMQSESNIDFQQISNFTCEEGVYADSR